MAPHYKFFNNQSCYTKSPQLKSYDQIVPPIQDRLAKIQRAHGFSHFKEQTTCNLIKRKYYWKTLQHDVKYYIDSFYNV